MSKDIRSYFGTAAAVKKTNIVENTKTQLGQSKKSKKRHVLSSDDDEDIVPCTPKNNKKSVKQNVKLEDVFGTEPVKQSALKVKPTKKQINSIEQDIDIEWSEIDNIEKKFCNNSDMSKKSPAKLNETNSSEKLKNKTLPTSKSPTKLNKTPIKSPAQFKTTPLKSPSVTQTQLTPKKLKSPSSSPNVKRKLMEFDSNNDKLVSLHETKTNPSKNTSSKTSESSQAGVKRKSSPVTSPEIKKFKPDLAMSFDSQESGYGTSDSIKVDDIKCSSPTLVTSFESKLWVEKYKPTTLKQIIGQTGEKSNVNKLLNWLKAWYSNHGIGVNTKLTRPSPWAKDDNGAYFKAALLSGSPGVGKTTTAHLVCKELGFDFVEFNASDTRSKKQLQNYVSELLTSTSLSPFLGGKSVTKKHALLMDEVDGMAGNEDRGGVQELVLLIKNAKCPIICMCNDRNHPKIRTLSNYCFDLRFHKPRLEQIKAAMMSVCFKENLKIPTDTLSTIIASTDNDIRLTLNHLSVVAAGKDNLNINKKYIKMGPWDVVRKVFSAEEHKTMNINDKCDLFFYDYNISPLFVQENYLSVVPHDIKGPKWKTFERYSLAADCISLGDIVNAKIRSTNNWSLLPSQAIFSSYCPGEHLKGHISKQINFPAWLGKFSKGNKMNRLLQEVQIHSRIRLSASKEAINLDYLTMLRDSIVKPLQEKGTDGVQQSLDFMHFYHLLKEDFESLVELSAWPGRKDPMSEIPAKVKSAFTRAYNKSSPAFSTTKKKKTSTLEDTEALLDDEEAGDDVLSDQEDDDDIQNDNLISIKKKTAKKASTPPPSRSKAQGSSKGRGGCGGRKKK